MGPQNRTDQIIARLAWRTHGVVTRRRLLAAGVSDKEIKVRLRRGSLIRLYPGVYRVGHAAPSVEATYMAAVLACGRGSELMGAPAAHLYELTKGDAPAPVIRTPTERRVAGIETHRTRSEARGTLWRGIPITTVPQTLMDLTSSVTEKDLILACHQAQVRFGVRPDQVRGRARRILAGAVPVTLSALEDRFLQRLHEHGLPAPRTNRHTRGRTCVDCRWPRRLRGPASDARRAGPAARGPRPARERREAGVEGDREAGRQIGCAARRPSRMRRPSGRARTGSAGRRGLSRRHRPRGGSGVRAAQTFATSGIFVQARLQSRRTGGTFIPDAVRSCKERSHGM